ncbi:MAG: 30S ribosomal protein S16, partial [Solirubrobacteraceae bacterium]|nr:30S ribosomal protein S16 [Solirubrobacteraceae bacterium]
SVDEDRVKHWLSVGAQPTNQVKKLLRLQGIKV